MFRKIDEQHEGSTEAGDSDQYDIALTFVTFAPVTCVILYTCYVGFWQLPHEVRAARHEYREAIEVAKKKHEQATSEAVKRLDSVRRVRSASSSTGAGSFLRAVTSSKAAKVAPV